MLVGCYSQSQIYSDQVRNVDLNKYSTYAWLPSQDRGDTSLYNNEILQSNLIATVDDQLQMRGFKGDGKNPDLLVLMHIMFEHETEVERTPRYSSYNYLYPSWYVFGGYAYYYNAYDRITYIDGFDIDTVHYTEGTVVVDIIEAKTNKLLWRGWSERLISPATYKNSLEKDVKAIFKEFPVKPGRNNASTKGLKEMQFYNLVGAW